MPLLVESKLVVIPLNKCIGSLNPRKNLRAISETVNICLYCVVENFIIRNMDRSSKVNIAKCVRNCLLENKSGCTENFRSPHYPDTVCVLSS